MTEQLADKGVQNMPYDISEREITHEVVCLAENGLGFGEGTIGTESRIAKGEATREDYRIVGEIIANDPEVFTTVDEDAPDDGCGDGRQAALIFRINPETGQFETFNKSRRRAKVFGGGLVVASSMWRAIDGPAKRNETVYGDREFIAEELAQMNIQYGAHTDNHAEGDKCGCGAIDQYPKITENIVDYKHEIIKTLSALYGDSFDDNKDAISSVFETYGVMMKDEDYFANAQGAKTMNLIQGKGSVVKQLADEHLEGRIILNDVEGTTVDQRVFDEKLRAAGVTSEVQLFVVDIWRGRMYADAVAKIAEKHIDADYENARKIAYADFLIRTLGVAARLTAGDLPVDARFREDRKDFGLAA
jgi:hypothetical protein